jgi:hypothetical protein
MTEFRIGTSAFTAAGWENAFRDAIDNAVELMRRLGARFPSVAKPR